MFRHAVAAVMVLVMAGISSPTVREDVTPAVTLEVRDAPSAAGVTSVGPGVDTAAELPATRNMIERFPDPAVLVVGSTYYAYATRQGPMNIQVSTSKDLVYWSEPRNALPEVPEWAQVRTWAPTVVQRGGTYVMWYTTRDRASARQCISVASSTSPLGPFVDRSSKAAICQVERGGSIDPEVFTDASGVSFLLWKSDDNAVGQATNLWSAPLSSDGTVVGSWSRLVEASAGWQGRLIEGPAMVASRGTYYLFYGANAWNSSNAAMGYATCDSPMGPCVDRSAERPWLATQAPMVGPSGPAFFLDIDGALRMTFHAWDACVGPPPCNRAAFFRRFTIGADGPVLSP